MSNNTPDYEDNLYFDTQNTKKDLCITSEQLTEQWKKGKLPEGWYYVKGSRVEGIYAYTAEYLNNMYRPGNGERIIEQVPSYNEWQAKLEENAQLKELLKECRSAYLKAEKNYGYDDSILEICSPMIDKIDEALR